MREKVVANLYIQMNVECPKCDDNIDLFNDVDYFNDEGQLWKLLEARSRKEWNNIDKEFECPHCQHEMIFDELDY